MMLELGAGQALFYEYDAPEAGKPVFVFVNALTGSTAAWQAEVGPALRAEGYGTLCYNFRGQAESQFAESDVLDERTIVSDLMVIVAHVAPPKPIYVGLSIGGLFAARAILKGAPAHGLVLINTLRKPGTALAWINEAVTRAAALGGAALIMDMNLPMLVGPAFLEKMRPNCLTDAPYAPLGEGDGAMQLLAHSRSADWDVPYEELSLPTLVLTGRRDRVFYNEDDVAELKARLPNASEKVFADYGHLLPMEAGPETANALSEFAGTIA